jgi:hypothetical protein
MVSLTTRDSRISITVDLKPPNVYLDHCVIRDFAQDGAVGGRFCRTLLEKNGTLCVSALHLIELSGICPGPTYSRIKGYLSAFENHFAVLEFEPAILSRKEHGTIDERRSAPVDFDLTRQVFSKWDGLSMINLAVLLDILEQNPSIVVGIRDVHTRTKSIMLRALRSLRKLYQTDAAIREHADASICEDPQKSSIVEYVFCQLRRQCIRQDLKESDIIDLFHSIVGTSYAQFVVLDKKWARRVRSIPLASGMAQAFGTNEYEEFLGVLAAWQAVEPDAAA